MASESILALNIHVPVSKAEPGREPGIPEAYIETAG